MQLILETEPTLAIKRDMSTDKGIPNEKDENGDIEHLNEKNYNGNKENIGDVNVIISDDVNKQVVVNEIDDASGNAPNDKKLENNDIELNNFDVIKEVISKVNSPESNDKPIEGSQNNEKDEEITSIGDIKKEIEHIPAETAQEDIVEDEKDTVSIKEDNFNQIVDIVEKESRNVVEKDETESKEELISTKNDVEVVDEPIKTPAKCETTTDVELVVENNETESSQNKDKHLYDDSKIVKEAPVCDSTEVILNKDVQDSSPIELKDDMDVEEIVEESKIDQQVKNTDSTEVISNKDVQDSSPIELKDDMDVEEIIEESKKDKQDKISQAKDTAPVKTAIDKPIICKLSNTLDILSDDEEEPPKKEPFEVVDSNEKRCINIEDDDDIMLIDEDTSKTEEPQTADTSNKEATITAEDISDPGTVEKAVGKTDDLFAKKEQKESAPPAITNDTSSQIFVGEKQDGKEIEKHEAEVPLLPNNFLKTAKKNLADMTRDDLEEFCILKIVESIVDRSNLSEIKNKLKSMAQGIEEYRKKAMMLTKQNRDLQVVLKSVQEEQKKMKPDSPITPLKITRSVGMQVFMEKSGARRKSLAQLQNSNNNNVVNRQNIRNASSTQSPRPQKPPHVANNQPIPVPRLVPANSPAIKTPSTIPLVSQIAPKPASSMPNGIKNPSPSQKVAEKRQHNRIMSVTVDLTDDEPPAKVNTRTSPAPPVRLVPSQNLMATPRQQFASTVSSPRKVYIPISGPQSQGIRPGQTIMLKTVPAPGLRQRCPAPQAARLPQNAVKMNRVQTGRHPAPLPDAMKQYQPPNWKALPPAPDLKLSKVENGIVISWKIEGYQEDSYEEIASYQLYAYQETSSPPSTALWKKIGDVKALPLPMACTLTQFMAGFKYYFAVRAVDIRSRLGPFSLPGSILLLNKL